MQQHINPLLFLHQVQQGFCFIYSPSFSVAGVRPFDIDLHFAWQVWHFCTSTVLLRGRRGTLWHGWNESNSHTRRFFVLVSLWNAFFFQSLAPVSKSDVCVYGGVSMRCFILCSKVMQNGCVLKWCLRVCSKVMLLPFYTEELLCTTTFAHKNFYTKKIHRGTFTHKKFNTQTRLHAETFPRKKFYAEKALYRSFCTE